MHLKLTFTIKWKLKQKKKTQNDVYTLPAFAKAFFIFCFVFSFELFKKDEEKFVMSSKLKMNPRALLIRPKIPRFPDRN